MEKNWASLASALSNVSSDGAKLGNVFDTSRLNTRFLSVSLHAVIRRKVKKKSKITQTKQPSIYVVTNDRRLDTSSQLA